MPTVFVHTSAVTPVMVAQIEEREKRVLRRRMRQTNDQDIGHTKRRRTAHGKGIVGGDRSHKSDDNQADSHEVENITMHVTCEELEKSEVGDGELVNSDPEDNDIEAEHINKQVETGGGEIDDSDAEHDSTNRETMTNVQVVSCEAADGKFAGSEPDNGHIVTEAGVEQVVSNEQAEISDGEEKVSADDNGEPTASDDVDSDDGDEEQESNEESYDHDEIIGEQEMRCPEEIHNSDEGLPAVPVLAVCCVPVPDSSRKSQVSIIKENDKATKFYTGLSSWKLFDYLDTFLQDACPCSTPGKLLSSECLLMVLMRLRLNLRVEDLSYRFGISLTTASDNFQRGIEKMFACMKCLIIWPSRDIVRSNMPQIFEELYPKTTCIIDCSEIFIERPCSYKARAQTYLNYKKHNTVKFLLGITPNGAISFLSKCWGGRATDKFIIQNCGFLQLVEHGDLMLADRGFDIADDLGVFGTSLEVPPYTHEASSSSVCKK